MAQERITIMDNDLYSAWCYPAKGLIQHKWHRYCGGDDFRKCLGAAMDALEKYHCDKWLSDDREFTGAMSHEDWQWCETTFSGRSIWEIWKYSAIVMPAPILAKISLQSLIAYFSSKGVEAKYFADFDEAQAWIAKK